MPNQVAPHLTVGAVIWALAVTLFFLVAIRLRIRSKIDYNGGGLVRLRGLLSRRCLGRTSFLCGDVCRIIPDYLDAKGRSLWCGPLYTVPTAVQFISAEMPRISPFNLSADTHTYYVGQGQWLVHIVCFPDANEIARRLGTTKDYFHKVLNGQILSDDSIKGFVKKLGAKNPDIGIDDVGNIVLKNPSNGRTINTGIPLSDFSQ